MMLLNPDPGAELPGKHLIPFPLAGRTANEPCSSSPAALLLLPAEVLWLHGCRGTLRIKGSVLGFVVWFGLGFFCLLFFAFCFVMFLVCDGNHVLCTELFSLLPV